MPTSIVPASATGSTSSSLIERAVAHDAEAWRRLSALYAPMVYRWARQTGLQSQDAADMVQEVFRSIATHLPGFHRDHPGDSFRGWLWTITRNKVRDHYRRRTARTEDDGAAAQARLQELAESISDDSALPVANAQLDLARRVLTMVQADFEPHTWQAFWKTTIDAATARDVAAELGMSVGAVYMAKSRVLARIREELAGLGES
jgi:RNA polymerase sigma-70 factor (ECF subfamily)